MSLTLLLAGRLKLPPWVIEAGLALLVILGFALWERHQGAASCRAADAALVKEQEAHNRDLKAQGTTTVFQEAHDYHDAIATPIARPVRLGLCQPASAVRTAGAPGQISDGPATVPGPSDGPPVPDESIGPQLQAVGRDADAQVHELQDYVVNVCRKR